jgi:hypothetical protein
MAEAGRGGMTLVFGCGALGRLREPASAIADARRWSEQVGVVGDAPATEVRAVVERTSSDPDFVSGEAGVAGSLAAIRQRFATDRHVFLGTSECDRSVGAALGWEYLPIEDAAEKADWALSDEAQRG